MDIHAANESASNTYHCSFENSEINIDHIVVAVAELKRRIFRFRQEIVAFKNENEIYLPVVRKSASLTPPEFNDLKNGEKQTKNAQYDLQRNFKGGDSLDGTDLSARLSFAKRAREVKAANEATVFIEDYRHDDKSIEDDEWPNRSRMFEPSRTYRKSIWDAEKFGKGIGEKSKDIGDAKISCVANEKLKKPKCELVSDTNCNYNLRNAITSKIKRKRVSRGVQYVSFGCKNHVGQFLLSCFRLKSRARKYSSVREVKKREALADKKKSDGPSEENKLLDTIIGNESHLASKEEIKLVNNTDIKKEKFENDEKKIEKITNKNSKKLLQSMDNDKKRKETHNLKNHKIKINLLEKLWMNRILSSNPKTQQNESQHNFNAINDPENNNEVVKLDFENERPSGKDNSQNGWSVNIFSHKTDYARKNATADSNRESDVNTVKKRLDLCITELNEIIGDACVILGGGKSAANKSG